MTFNLNAYLKANYPDLVANTVLLRNEEQLTEFDDIQNRAERGQGRASIDTEMKALGVAAKFRRRVLAGERLAGMC